MSTAAIRTDIFPRRQAYTSATCDGRTIIGFKGYEVVQQSDGTWTLSSTPGGHDAPHSIVEDPAS